MRITLADEHSARAVGIALERYGYKAERVGRIVLTDCPALLAVGVAERTVGLGRVAKAEIGESKLQAAADQFSQAAV